MTPAMVTVGAVIVAAGESRRMRGIDKILTPLVGRPLVAHTIEAFNDSPRIGRIVLVLSGNILDRGRRLVEEGGWDKVTDVCAGGARRQDSVRAGLDRLSDVEWVVVHDGARPLVDADIIGRGLDAAAETGAAVAAVPVTDTIKRAGPGCIVVDTPPREELWAAQTPQVFRRSVLAEAHGRVAEDVTDDAAMVERTGGAVKLFMGSYENIKVSTPEDLAAAQVLLESRAASEGPKMTVRSGIGVDAHPLVGGRPLVLGGVDVPFEKGLGGHSDGDVLIHAMIDALLGAAGMGDIGDHFPASDPDLKGIASTVLLARTVDLLAARKWRATYVDATIIAERPALKPYMGRMKRSIADSLGLREDEVNLKATTTDGLGFVGRGDGISTIAVATTQRQE